MGLKDTLFGKVLRKKETTQKSHKKIDIYAEKVESIDDLELSSELEKSIPRDLMDKIRIYDKIKYAYKYKEFNSIIKTYIYKGVKKWKTI